MASGREAADIEKAIHLSLQDAKAEATEQAETDEKKETLEEKTETVGANAECPINVSNSTIGDQRRRQRAARQKRKRQYDAQLQEVLLLSLEQNKETVGADAECQYDDAQLQEAMEKSFQEQAAFGALKTREQKHAEVNLQRLELRPSPVASDGVCLAALLSY